MASCTQCNSISKLLLLLLLFDNNMGHTHGIYTGNIFTNPQVTEQSLDPRPKTGHCRGKEEAPNESVEKKFGVNLRFI